MTWPYARGSFFFQAEDGIRDFHVTGVQTCALPISLPKANCVVKGDLWRNRYWRGVLKAAGFISNDNAEDLLAGCQRALDRGESRSEERRVGRECRYTLSLYEFERGDR